MRITRFIEQAHTATSIEMLAGMMCDVLDRLGYRYFCCYTLEGLLPDTEAAIGTPPRMHYSAGFIAEYRDKRYLDSDPVFKLLCRARGPFTWEQVMQLPLTPRQQAVMKARENAGLIGGVGVPLQSADPSLVGINVVAEGKEAITDNTTLSQVFAACNQYQLERARILNTAQDFTLPEIQLTPREREMLEWAAQGKSNGVIASILGISDKTVEFHFKSIFTKLDVASRTTAVLKAVKMRLIHIEEWS